MGHRLAHFPRVLQNRRRRIYADMGRRLCIPDMIQVRTYVRGSLRERRLIGGGRSGGGEGVVGPNDAFGAVSPRHDDLVERRAWCCKITTR
jgi:hypothetical protein